MCCTLGVEKKRNKDQNYSISCLLVDKKETKDVKWSVLN